jgi:tetratricopeptide (TPR) repeat protein
MASIIPGYNYDIFISYRQKDNKGDGWVSKFVEALKDELESTFKEEISVYFDINPHDGLLDTHDVDASLKEKLKCLIFIPIISRTYCDPKSFAWNHEFVAFVKQVSQDKFGLKVKLPNGNVANRILPIRIHDLDTEDVNCFETKTGGVMRTLDFVFKTASGVNRPLKPREDHPGDNLNKTYYQDQINKVALAIKEIFQGIKVEPEQAVKEKDQTKESIKEAGENKGNYVLEKYVKSGKFKLISSVAVIALLITTAILAYPKIFKRNTLDKLRSSGERIVVAVMPFQNLTNDTLTWNVYQEIIQNSLTSYLSNFQEYLQVRQTESINNLLNSEGRINYASITPSFAGKVSQKLEADVFVYGNIIKSGNVIRLSAQLTDTKTGEIIKSFQIEGLFSEGNLLPKIDTLSGFVKDFLVLFKLKKDRPKEQTADIYYQVTTNSPEAYIYYIYGMNAPDFKTTVDWFKKAIAIDSNFVLPYTTAIYFYIRSGRYDGNISAFDSAKKWCLKIYERRDKVPLMQQLLIKAQHAALLETQDEENKYLQQILNIDDQQPITYFMLADNYRDMGECDKAIPVFIKGIEVYEKWGIKPFSLYYDMLFRSYYRTGQYEEGKKLLLKRQKDYPNSSSYGSWAILSFVTGDTISGNKFVKERLSNQKMNSESEENILKGLINIYSWGHMPDKARECCHKLLSLQSISMRTLTDCSWRLLEDDRTVNEALEFAERALALSPENHTALHRKGWALYKLGRYEEALEFMQKSWDIRMKTTVYNHELYLHLQAAKKAVANLKNY